jgi:electron transport complex protein RnfB
MSEVYERLRERLDMFPQGFPKTKSGVELEILKRLFTPDEAEIMLFLRPYPEPVASVSERMGRSEPEMTDMLYQMSKKGLILRGTIQGQTFYFMAPWMVGIWEFQLNNLNQDNIPLYEKFYQESSRRFAVADCICRKEATMMGHGCDKLLEACMTFDLAADYYIENGLGREISKKEAHEILLKAEESGLVHHSSNHKGNKMFICNCCGCCCKAMAHINKYNNPAAIAHSNYYAEVDAETCAACETCVERCQVNAVRMEDDVSVIAKDRCIGCGLCASSCPTESITMVQKQPKDMSVIFENQDVLIQTMAKEKNKTFPFQ